MEEPCKDIAGHGLGLAGSFEKPRPFECSNMSVVHEADLDALAAWSTSEWRSTHRGARGVTFHGESDFGSAVMQDTGTRDLHDGLAGTGMPGLGRQSGRSSLEFCTQSQTITLRVFEQ